MLGNEYLGLDVGQANELKLAFRRFDWDNTLIKKLCEGDNLGDVLDILRGDAHVVPTKRIVNLSANPVLRDDVKIVKHLRQGKKPWNKVRMVVMDPNELQYDSHNVNRNPLGSKDLTSLNEQTFMPLFLRGQRPANVCMRNFLLKNPHLIPFGWRFHSHPILFWGTILRNDHCNFVPGLTPNYGKWSEYGRRIDEPIVDSAWIERYDNPCVVFAPTLSS